MQNENLKTEMFNEEIKKENEQDKDMSIMRF